MWVEIVIILSLFFVSVSIMVQNTRRLNSVLDENKRLKEKNAELESKAEALEMENGHLIDALKEGQDKDGMVSKPPSTLKSKTERTWKKK
jgi:regulator of replication initiation timing